MRKENDNQIEGQMNIFDFTDDFRPAEFYHEKKEKPKGICSECLFAQNPCIWMNTKTPCIHGASKITKADGWHRIMPIVGTGYVKGEYPTNTTKREKIEVIIKTKADEMHIAAAEGINESIILPRGTPEGFTVAWRYMERGSKNEQTDKNASEGFKESS